ncbi:5-formyltetrahydrofolate cyclo-ligase [Dacryopinax primogenitus]|uniref:5-formyltetrahydrofolate cyclo-ligase n=1 Tax=Dacryopinax primogenitus (strain DJM 731) TaxID=1858805 RepID=M5GFF6_DACPD|nr:5-formyltetrahydrofolate cyclo-ligase [Dacryopinax primogenitus]EJU06237.1 5-formyltetrahydrofolate cyclo-ligase [Dacryopinax primogenitus]
MSAEDCSDGPMWTQTMALKKLVRSQVKEVLEKLSTTLVENESKLITQHVLRSSAYKNSRGIACYLTMEKQAEVNTHAIVVDALKSGKRVYVPRINFDRLARKNSRAANRLPGAGKYQWMSMLRLYSLHDLNGLSKNTWGIPEPTVDGPEGIKREDLASMYTENVDLVLMPGVAFDRNLSRLGHGKGFYDKWLSHYASTHSKGSRPILMGLALAEQIVPRIPIEPHDWPLDMIVTPNGIMTPEGQPLDQVQDGASEQ